MVTNLNNTSLDSVSLCESCDCINEFECNSNGNCIPLEYANDGEDDCADGSDEGTIGKKICRICVCKILR